VAEYLPDYAFDSWVGIAGPKNIRADIVEVLNREINASLARPEIKAKYDDLGLRIHAGSPADFGKLIAADTEKWGKVIRAANIKLD
jgi:tripartite-type tricarboxylate transporter receptor subunit TctC